MEQIAVAQPGTVPLTTDSTDLSKTPPGMASGGGDRVPVEKQEPEKPVSLRETIKAERAAAIKEAEAAEKPAKEATKETKAETEEPGKEADKPAKDNRSADGKFAKAQTDDPDQAKADKGAVEKPATGQDGSERRQSEGRHSEPPARFLPEARAKWAPVPREVKAELHRVVDEYEAELSQHRQSAEAFKDLHQYDEMAKSSGKQLSKVVADYVGMEQKLWQNPTEGFRDLLHRRGIDPQQFAQHILRNPQFYAQQSQPAQQPAQRSPEVQTLQGEVQELRSMIRVQTVTPLIERFADEHPDYHALEGQIANVLQSGVIDKNYGSGLSPEQKLLQAYRMVGGREVAASHSDPVASQANSQAERTVDTAGRKSIRGAPTDGGDPEDEDRPEIPLRELLRRELRAAKG